VRNITTRPPKLVATAATDPIFAPDGRYLAIPTTSGATLHDAETGEKHADLTKPGDVTSSHFFSYNGNVSYPSVTFSPDGKLIVVAGLYRTEGDHPMTPFARVWRTATSEQLRTLDSCQSADFGPNGRSLVIRTAVGTLALWRIVPNDSPGPDRR
jgi:WD40 repeat protein